MTNENYDGPGDPERLAKEQGDLLRRMEQAAGGLTFADLTSKLSSLVGSAGLRNELVHRWYYYKEGFSPLLPSLLVDSIGLPGTEKVVADTFAGVGTTALALRHHEAVGRVVGVEYSPFAHFVGHTKLRSLSLDVPSLTAHEKRLSKLRPSRTQRQVPSLAAFHNHEIFHPEILSDLLTMRDRVQGDVRMSDDERAFFRLGIAAVVEDLSGAMKDGRALRILRGRKRRRQGLRPTFAASEGSDVRSVVTNQWRAMIEDLQNLQAHGPSSGASLAHVRGDARSLADVKSDTGGQLLPDESVGLHLYSPPYLNFLDYTEVYKLELWLLGFVSDQAEFRAVREGTLRSHPSIEFAARPRPENRSGNVFGLIDDVTNFLIRNLARPSVGRVHGHYFADMDEVLREQFRTLTPGGSIACVVANSIFSRRAKDADRSEIWRLPVYTDVIIARLAEAAGFSDIEIWVARTLQAKNVSGGLAREAVVVAKKPA